MDTINLKILIIGDSGAGKSRYYGIAFLVLFELS